MRFSLSIDCFGRKMQKEEVVRIDGGEDVTMGWKFEPVLRFKFTF